MTNDSSPNAESRILNADAVPYFCQWESADLADAIVNGRATPADDPLWQASGALDQQEYITWANHVCGMICFKMVWAVLSGRVIPSLELTRVAMRYGAYTLDENGIHGMIYAPFVTFLREDFDIESRIEVNQSAKNIPALLQEGAFFIASVHPDIRWADRMPPRKGGHLILVTAADEKTITFHNPSGHTRETQENVMLSHETFDHFFAGRGILIVGEIEDHE
jgi:hypothetical protein